MPSNYPPNSPDFIHWLTQRSKRANEKADYLKNQPHFSPWITPTLLNGFIAPGGSKQSVKYRLHFKGDALEFAGHIDATNAVSNTVAFTLIQLFWPTADISFITDIETGTATFSTCRVYISSVNGNVTLTWPAT